MLDFCYWFVYPRRRMEEKLSLPKKLLAPIKHFLEKELVKLKRTKKNLKKSDPFKDSVRTSENSFEEDLDEQIGHFDTQVKVNFVQKQIIQIRKALTMIKIGRYGVCEKCGKMIDTDRLAVFPDTTVCIKCERERES
jgi:RNA polymerase-binding transcription factor DksA